MIDTEILTLVGGAALKAAVILAIAGLITIAWRTASASARHLIWTVSVAASLAIPPLTLAIGRLDAPRIEVSAWTRAATPIETRAPLPSTQVAHDQSPAARDAIEPAPLTEQPVPEISTRNNTVRDIAVRPNAARRWAPAVDWSAALLDLWLAGIVVALLPLLIAIVRVRSLARSARVVYCVHSPPRRISTTGRRSFRQR